MTQRRDHKGPRPISGILRDVLKECGLSERIRERDLIDGWTAMVGPEIAAHSRAVDIQDGVLVIDADHGAWRQELSLLIPEIIRKFNAAYGDGAVREVRWLRSPARNRKNVDGS